MSISIAIAVHPLVSLPPGSRIHVQTPIGSQIISIPGPGMFFDSQLVGTLPSFFEFSLKFEIGTQPIDMRVAQAPDDLRLALTVLPSRRPQKF